MFSTCLTWELSLLKCTLQIYWVMENVCLSIMYILKDQEWWGNRERMATSTVFWLLLLLLKNFLSHSCRHFFFCRLVNHCYLPKTALILALQVLYPGKSPVTGKPGQLITLDFRAVSPIMFSVFMGLHSQIRLLFLLDWKFECFLSWPSFLCLKKFNSIFFPPAFGNFCQAFQDFLWLYLHLNVNLRFIM